MLGKIWKKIGLIILIIFCLWNIVFKLVNKISFDGAIQEAKKHFIKEKNQTVNETYNQKNNQLNK